MNKLLVIGAAVAGAVLLARRLAPRMGTIDWEKKLAAMPDTAPPKWMFTNIAAIRDNTERILELLESPTSRDEIGTPGGPREPREAGTPPDSGHDGDA